MNSGAIWVSDLPELRDVMFALELPRPTMAA